VSITQQEASLLLVSSHAPVLFLDTCILLDVLRTPIRENLDVATIELAQRFCDLSNTTPRRLWLVTSETVLNEWHENVANVKHEVQREILRQEKKRLHLISAVKAANNVKYESSQQEGVLNLEIRLESISRSLLDACLVVKPEDAHMINAMNRVKKYLPPSRRGKSEAKDCEIFEVFLGICRELRSVGFTHLFLFASSNTEEYEGDNAISIKNELNQINAKFVNNLKWAMSLIAEQI
jgi:hypothetical protein